MAEYNVCHFVIDCIESALNKPAKVSRLRVTMYTSVAWSVGVSLLTAVSNGRGLIDEDASGYVTGPFVRRRKTFFQGIDLQNLV